MEALISDSCGKRNHRILDETWWINVTLIVSMFFVAKMNRCYRSQGISAVHCDASHKFHWSSPCFLYWIESSKILQRETFQYGLKLIFVKRVQKCKSIESSGFEIKCMSEYFDQSLKLSTWNDASRLTFVIHWPFFCLLSLSDKQICAVWSLCWSSLYSSHLIHLKENTLYIWEFFHQIMW